MVPAWESVGARCAVVLNKLMDETRSQLWYAFVWVNRTLKARPKHCSNASGWDLLRNFHWRKLLIDTLDHATNLRWLKKQIIVNVCCLGKMTPDNFGCKDYSHAWRYRWNSIYYYEWTPSLPQVKRFHWEVFHGLQKVLQVPKNRVLVHCRSGRHRSCPES